MRTMLLELIPLLSLAGSFAATVASAATWTIVSSVGGDGAALAARAPSGAVYAIPGDRRSLFRTDDRGARWTRVTLPAPPSPSLPLAIAAAADGVYLDYQHGNVARSTDGGASWAFRKLPGTSERIVPGPARASTSCSTGGCTSATTGSARCARWRRPTSTRWRSIRAAGCGRSRVAAARAGSAARATAAPGPPAT